MADPAYLQAICDEMSAVRTDPTSLIPFLEAKIPRFDGTLYREEGKTTLQTKEGVAVINELIEYLKTAPTMEPMTLNMEMNLSAEQHVADIGPNGICGHTGSDGSQPQDRIEKYGEWEVTCGENIDFGNTDPKDIVCALMVDDGVPGRGHRHNIMTPEFLVCGIATGPHTVYGNCCVMTLAGGYGPKREVFDKMVVLTDVCTDNIPEDFEPMMASIPDDDLVQEIRDAIRDGHKVDLDYKIREIDVTVKEASGAMGMFGAAW